MNHNIWFCFLEVFPFHQLFQFMSFPFSGWIVCFTLFLVSRTSFGTADGTQSNRYRASLQFLSAAEWWSSLPRTGIGHPSILIPSLDLMPPAQSNRPLAFCQTVGVLVLCSLAFRPLMPAMDSTFPLKSWNVPQRASPRSSTRLCTSSAVVGWNPNLPYFLASADHVYFLLYILFILFYFCVDHSITILVYIQWL